jgi:formamidopyrimidine-DNA glycosylase
LLCQPDATIEITRRSLTEFCTSRAKIETVPELPDIVVYIESLTARIVGKPLERIHVINPFVLRSVSPPLEAVEGQLVTGVRRVGKRIVVCFDGELFLVLHLMIAGRLRWRDRGRKAGLGGKILLASFEFPEGTLFFTEASSTKRASMLLIQGQAALTTLDPGGVEPLETSLAAFRERLTARNHTIKRALTDPHLVSGIGNAYSDEILHAAQLSPTKLTRSLTDEEYTRLYAATRRTLEGWIERLRAEAAGGFPEKVTAFHDQMAVHGRFRLPCPVCGAPVQRIVYAENECNYCPRCQTGGRLLADRSLSRLLKTDWPKSLDEL